MNIFFILQIVLLLIQICSLFMECYYFIVKDDDQKGFMFSVPAIGLSIPVMLIHYIAI